MCAGHNGHQSSGHIGPGIASPWTPRPKDWVSSAIPSRTTVNFPDCNKQNEPWPRRRFGRLYETTRSFFFMFKAYLPSCLRRFTARSFVLRRNHFGCSSRWLARYAVTSLFFSTHIYSNSQLFARIGTLSYPSTLRRLGKWVAFLFSCFIVTTVTFFTSKQSRGMMRRTNFVRKKLSRVYLSLTFFLFLPTDR